jgi:hypothetical protein
MRLSQRERELAAAEESAAGGAFARFARDATDRLQFLLAR